MYLRDLQQRFGGEILGEVQAPLTGVASLENAGASTISFLANPKYRRALDLTHAAAVIVDARARDTTTKPRIVTDNPYAYFAKVAQLFSPAATYAPGVHTSAVIDPTAQIAASASIAEFVSIGAGVAIGEGVRVGAGCVIGEGVFIGAGSVLVARVTVYAKTQIGLRALIHAGVVLGADGFGFAEERHQWVKIPQIGRVVIGDDVEIGANTTIDRGAMDDTMIGNGVKLDNQIQIGHNCVIGEHTIIAGCTGIAGSTIIGKRVKIGGAVSITGHLSICDDASLTANAFVTKSITEPGMYSAGFPLMAHKDWLKNAVQLRHLDEMAAKLVKLTKSQD